MQSVVRSESGKQVRMSGDSKVQDRSEKRNDLVQQFSASREALKRAMEKDIQTVRQTVRAQSDDTQGSTRIVEEHDANATRLAALLEAARNQEDMPPEDAGSAQKRTAEGPVTRSIGAPVAQPPLERHPESIRRPDVAGRPETSARPIADPVLPPLVDREEEFQTVSGGKIVLRLAVLAVIIGAIVYSYLVPKEKDAIGLVPGSTAVAPGTPPESNTDPSSEHGVAGASGTAADITSPISDEASSAATAKTPTSNSGTVGPGETGMPQAATESAMSAVPAPITETSAAAVQAPPVPAARPFDEAVTISSKAATAAPVVPANIRAPVARTKAEIPAPPEPAVVRPSLAPKVENLPPSVRVEPTVKAVSTAAPAAIVAPSSAAVGAEVGTDTTAMTPPAPPPENPSAENAVPAPAAAADAAISLQPPADAPRSAPTVIDRRPYFQRLGPTPVRNPFRSVPQTQPPPAPFTRSVYDIE